MPLKRKLADGLALYLFCLTVSLLPEPAWAAAPAALGVFTVAALLLYVDSPRLVLVAYLGYSLVALMVPTLVAYLPLMAYLIAAGPYRWWAPAGSVPLAGLVRPAAAAAPALILSILAASLVGLLLQRRGSLLNRLEDRYFRLEDDSRLMLDRLEERRQRLMQQQDSLVELSALEERARIARDIHDNVGHLLSSALLQTAALQATVSDSTAARNLAGLEQTLAGAMASVRDSVHSLHESTVNLEHSILRLVDEFGFCPVDCSVNLYGSPAPGLSYALIAIVKEGLSNIMRHSTATTVRLSLREHPAFYQLSLENDGCSVSTADLNSSRGMGLRSIRERTERLAGSMTVEADGRFRLFLTIPRTPALTQGGADAARMHC